MSFDQQEVVLLAKEIANKACRGGSRMVLGDKVDQWEDYFEVPAELIAKLREQFKMLQEDT